VCVCVCVCVCEEEGGVKVNEGALGISERRQMNTHGAI